jgi:hypothetical protein
MGLLGSSHAVSDAMDMLAEASVLVDIMCWDGIDEVLVIYRICVSLGPSELTLVHTV